MEVVFDSGNVLNSKIRTRYDNSIVYMVNTKDDRWWWWGRTITYLKDNNPIAGGTPVVVGAINWQKKAFEIKGVKRELKQVRRKLGNFGKKKVTAWKWEHDEYEISHQETGWEAKNMTTGLVEETLLVPYRPQLFGKQPQVVFNLNVEALRDEVFLILAMIYLEAKRLEKVTLLE